jgi:hypothetical protein
MRVKLMVVLGNVRIPLQVDVGAGDAVVPPPELQEFPGLLDLPRATLRMYRPETAIAEKTEAMVQLGHANSRMKDFFDIHALAMTRAFDGETLRHAMAATFARRGTEIPTVRPAVGPSRAAASDRAAGRFPLASASGRRAERAVAVSVVERRAVGGGGAGTVSHTHIAAERRLICRPRGCRPTGEYFHGASESIVRRVSCMELVAGAHPRLHRRLCWTAA